MKCPNCNTELVDGALFCGSCGTKIKYRDDRNNENEQGKKTVCPKCGKPVNTGDLFCDGCGYNLAETPDHHWWKKFVVFLLGILVLLFAAAGGFHIYKNMGAGAKNQKEFSKVFYFKDGSLMMKDVKNIKEKPIEITDSLVKSGQENLYPSYQSVATSENEKYIVFAEDYDGEVFDLYFAKTMDPVKKTKVDSKVESYKLLNDGSILYKKKESLYYYTGESEEARKFGKNVEDYGMDEAQKTIYWSEIQNDEERYYLQDLAGKKEKVSLGKGIDWFIAAKDFSYFYILKGDDLYAVNPAGEKEKIAKGVNLLSGCNEDTGDVLYTKEKTIEIPYSDFVKGNVDDTERWKWNILQSETYSYDQTSLWIYDGKQEHCISENMKEWQFVNLSEDGNYMLFLEGPAAKEVSVDFSASFDEIGNRVESAMTQQEKLVFCNGAERIAEYEGLSCRRAQINTESGKLYLQEDVEENEEAVIYETNISGTGAGVLQEYDTGSLQFVTKDGTYYIKDYSDNSGDLYFNGKRIITDVFTVNAVGKNGKFCYSQDYDSNDGSKSVAFWDGDEQIKIADDVMRGWFMENGTAILLTDYSQSSEEGNLVYFDGKQLNTLDTDVSSIINWSCDGWI